jgi:UDP-3-O-acyl N-acetylglucosamine deacetylase
MRLQRTIKKAVVFEGRGIHSGDPVKLTIKKASVDTGIIFIRRDLEKRLTITANVSSLAAYSGGLRCTSIKKNSASVYTIEHLMAALSGLSIDNATIEINNQELPALDGSALDYAMGLQKGGILEQEKERKEFFLKKVILCRDENALLIAIPSKDFSISYLLKYDDSEFMTQYADFSFDCAEKKKDIFIKEIAPARTFCLEKEVSDIRKRGLGKGGNYKNTLIIRDGKPIQNEFRFPDEPVRHKIVDLLGDLALLNAEVKAHIIGIRSGHALNKELLKKLEKLL